MAGRKKILFIVEAMGGGVFTCITDLANELVQNFDLSIAYGVRKQMPEDYRSYFDQRIHLIRVNNFKRNISPVSDMKAFLEIKQIASEVYPDIIHLHSSKAGILGRIAFWNFKKNAKTAALFYTPHGYSFLMRNHSLLKRMLYRMLEAVCGKSRCITVSCSPGEHRESLKLARKAVCVNNGVNIDNLKKDCLRPGRGKMAEKKEHPFTVFTLGRICAQKNPALFNEIAAALPDIRFVWIGDGELLKELKAPNVEVTGWMDRRSALETAANADAFILTSLWEGLPISLLEAMFMKKPCIVSDVIGNNDVIKNGVNGQICSKARDFAAAIERIRLQDGTVQMTKAAYDDVMQIYNTKVMAACYRQIYRGDFYGVGEEYDKECFRSETAD